MGPEIELNRHMCVPGLAEKVQDIEIDLDISSDEVARAAGIDEKRYSGIRNGEIDLLEIGEYIPLCSALGVNLETGDDFDIGAYTLAFIDMSIYMKRVLITQYEWEQDYRLKGIQSATKELNEHTKGLRRVIREKDKYKKELDQLLIERNQFLSTGKSEE